MTNLINEDTVNLPEDPLPEHQPTPPLPHPQTAQPLPAARQTRSGRAIYNTLRYKQSVTQRNQELVAWEVLLDQDDRGGRPNIRVSICHPKGAGKPNVLCRNRQPRHIVLGPGDESPQL